MNRHYSLKFLVALPAMIGAAPLLADPGCFAGFADPVFYRAQLNIGGPSEIAAGDFDGDGDVDLVAGIPTDRVMAVFLNHGDGMFADAAYYPVGEPKTSSTQGIEVGDVTGDSALWMWW